ncbi:MAG: prolyl oligopeptidase family serine peptidase [Lentisphaerales bacterium]|nr:prolyl oligopeptidase family serine peptidase [Lentisphaerales bacterium]
MRCVFLIILFFCASSYAEISPITQKIINKASAKDFNFHGYSGKSFQYKGFEIKIVSPKVKDEQNRWIWRARFFGHEPQLDKALLERGFHLVYANVANLFGSPQAVSRWNKTYDLVTKAGLQKRPVLEGMSRGGLIIYNWAKQNPDKVACIYADAPVNDILSWPGGKLSGPGAKNLWPTCLKVYGLTEETAKSAQVSPIHGLEKLATAKVPLIHVCGANDKVVPINENTDILAKRYNELGGEIKVISKPGVGHHPHSLKNPKPILDFILEKGKF